jgi:radical SAM superfamily enzyme YgiQ (UPF0313 family)
MKKPAKNKCILISTPLVGKTLSRGVLSIASFLESRGFPTQIIPLGYHLGFNKDYSSEELTGVLKEFIQNTEPLLVGVSNQFTGDYPTCLEILKTCKQLNKNIVTVIGGVHVTFQDTECLDESYVDIVVRGEGEWTLLDLVQALENKTDLQDVKGLTFRKNDRVVRTSDRPLGDLDELPQLDFNLLPTEFVQQVFVHGMLNRGCDFKCSFCGESAFWRKRRSIPVKQVVVEMETLDSVYGNPMCALDDSMGYIGSEQFAELCNEIRARKIKLHKNFYIMSRVDTFHEHDLKNLKGTGIRYVELGIESASPKVLKMMNKKTDREKIIACCAKLKRNNFKTHGLWMIGHPGDNPEEAQYSLDTLEYLLKNDLMDKVEISVFTPCPGTKFFDQPEKYGIEILTRDWANWNYYFIPLTDLVAGTYKQVCQLKDFPANEIIKFYKKAHAIVMQEKPDALRYTHDEFYRKKQLSTNAIAP